MSPARNFRFLEPRQEFQVGSVPVHAENAFSDDDHPAVIPVVLLHQGLQLVHILMAEADTFPCGQPYTVYDACMDKLVGEDKRRGIAHCRKYPYVHVVPAAEHQGGLSAGKTAKHPLHSIMDIESACKQP